MNNRYIRFIGIFIFIIVSAALCMTCGDSADGPSDNGQKEKPQPPTNTITSPKGIELVLIPDGSFLMGSPDTEEGRVNTETMHQVTLTKSFYIGKYQVTQEQYLAVMGTNPSNYSGNPAEGEIQEKRPVEHICWYDMLVFCNKLSALENLTPAYSLKGSTDPDTWGTVPTSNDSVWDTVEMVTGSTGYRLPTEAQWEYACRAETTTAYNAPPPNGSNTASADTGWNTSNSGGMTHQVGLKSPNAWGLYDTHGNVWELCWDWSGNYASGAQTDPTGPSTGATRVGRGGAYNQPASLMRSAHRNALNPSYRGYYLGFRLLRPYIE